MTPQLRFPEFTDDWHVKKLGELGKFTSGVGFTNSEQGGRHGTPFYKVSDMNLSGNTNEMTQANNYVSDTQVIDMKYKPIIDKSIIFAKVGAAIFLERKRVASNFLIDNNMMAFTPNGNLDFQYIKIVFDRLHLSKMAQVGALPSYNGSDLAIIKVQLPSHKEQEKIADFLAAVDERIRLGEQKLAKLEQYKRGVMQKIFSQQIRFKDENGNPYPGWEEKKLKEVVEFIQNGLSVDQGAKRQGKKVTRIETISNNEIDPSKVGYIVTNKDISHYKLKKGDMLFSNINSPAHIGRIVYVNKDYDDIYHGMNLLRIRINELNNAKYIYYVLSSAEYKKWFERICNKAVNQASINQTDLGCTEIVLPKLEEQQKIADLLTTLDDKITAEKSKLTAARQFKKALLQRMFV